MAYEPTIWETGDIITAFKLNKIEHALSSFSATVDHPIVVLHADAEGVLDHTAQEIMELIDDGKILYVDTSLVDFITENEQPISLVAYVDYDEEATSGAFNLRTRDFAGIPVSSYISDSISDYPCIDIGPTSPPPTPVV